MKMGLPMLLIKLLIYWLKVLMVFIYIPWTTLLLRNEFVKRLEQWYKEVLFTVGSFEALAINNAMIRS